MPRTTNIVMFMYEKLSARTASAFEPCRGAQCAVGGALLKSRDPARGDVEGAALYMVHVSAATAWPLERRARGFPMYGETCTST